MFRDLYFLLSTLCDINKRQSFFKSVYPGLKDIYKETRGIELDDGDKYIRGKISENVSSDIILVITDNAKGGDIIFNEKDASFTFVYFLPDPLKTDHTAETLFDLYFDIIRYIVLSINYKVDAYRCDQNSTFVNYLVGLQYMMAISLTNKLFPEISFEKIMVDKFDMDLEDANEVVRISKYKTDGVPMYDGYKVGVIMSKVIAKTKQKKEGEA